MSEHLNKTSICDACGSAKLQPHKTGKKSISIQGLKPENFRITNKDYGSSVEALRCSNCGLVMPSKILSPKAISSLYAQMEDNDYTADADLRAFSSYRQLKKSACRYIQSADSILEIGSGCGSLLNLLKADTTDLTGIEPSTSLADFSKKNYNLNILNIDFESYQTQKKFSIIIALDVLEHTVSPSAFLIKIHSLLNEDGLALIAAPDIESFTAKILGKRWWHIKPPHLFYFSSRSFKILADKCGLNILSRKRLRRILPASYLLISIQQWVFKKIFCNFKFLKIPVNLNTFDSDLFLLGKK